jgi:hypothetical protein
MPGYEKITSLLGNDEDLAMYRRFRSLGTKTLLYMQAELLHLEEKLKNQVKRDLESSESKERDFDVYWKTLDEAPDNGLSLWQKETVQAIKLKLTEYCETQSLLDVDRIANSCCTDEFLLLTAKVKGLSKPLGCDYRYFNQWLDRPIEGTKFLKGIEARAWLPKYESDLILSTWQPGQKDSFAQFMIDQILPWYHRLIGVLCQKPTSNEDMPDTWHYKKKSFVVLGDIICMLLSTLIPTVSILVLYSQKSNTARLIVITAMSFVCSAIMMFVVRGRRVDVFAATTAFAAVQVFFLGGQDYQHCTSSP